MLKNVISTILFYIAFYFFQSCTNDTAHQSSQIKPDEILKSEITLLQYCNKYVKLSDNFIAYDSLKKIMSTDEFFRKLITGNFLPIRILSDDTISYELYRLSNKTDERISSIIKNLAILEYQHYQMEGKPIPNFEIIDLNGIKYTNETIKDKIVVVKCWFIRCQACNEEIPGCNSLVTQYQNRKDILFISLAIDKPEDLKIFLAKTPLKYAVIPNQEEFMADELQIKQYPTHLIIDKKGVIYKFTNTFTEVISGLSKLISVD